MNVEYINPFIEAGQTVIQMLTGVKASMGKVYLKGSPYTSDVIAIIIGLTGAIKGQVILTFNKETATGIASAMMGGMQVTELDDLSKSALSELANMILGNAATIFSNRGLNVEITPPSMLTGENITVSSDLQTICIPLDLGNEKKLEIDVSLKEN